MMYINRTSAPSHTATASSSRNGASKLLDGIIKSVRAVISSPLTLAVGLAMTLPALVRGNAAQASALPLSNGTLTNGTTSSARGSSVSLPFDVKSIAAAVKHAHKNNQMLNVGWMLYDKTCEEELNEAIFSDKAKAAAVTTWRTEVGGSVVMQTKLTPVQGARALGVAVFDAIKGHDCVQSMYVDPFDMPEVVARLEARDEVERTIAETKSDNRCLKVLDYQVKGRNSDGDIVFRAHFENCHTQAAKGTSIRMRRDLSAVSAANATAASAIMPDSTDVANVTQAQQVQNKIEEIRFEHCPEKAHILHSVRNTTLTSTAQLQEQIKALCPNATIVTASSLDAPSSARDLGVTTLTQLLSALPANANSTGDVWVVANPRLEGVEGDTTALVAVIQELEKAGITVFAADDKSWVAQQVSGVSVGGGIQQQLVQRSVRKALQKVEVIIDDGVFPTTTKPSTTTPTPQKPKEAHPAIFAVVGVVAVLLVAGAAGAIYRARKSPDTHCPDLEIEEIDDATRHPLTENEKEVTRTSEEQTSLLDESSLAESNTDDSADSLQDIISSFARDNAINSKEEDEVSENEEEDHDSPEEALDSFAHNISEVTTDNSTC